MIEARGGKKGRLKEGSRWQGEISTYGLIPRRAPRGGGGGGSLIAPSDGRAAAAGAFIHTPSQPIAQFADTSLSIGWLGGPYFLSRLDDLATHTEVGTYHRQQWTLRVYLAILLP